MINKKLIIAALAGLVVLGGAVGVGAMSTPKEVVDLNTVKNEVSKKAEEILPVEKAVDIAIKELGGQLESVELEKDDGRLYYEIELVIEGDGDIDIDIDAITGKVIKTDDFKKVKSGYPVNKREVNITLEQALAIAKKDSPGRVVETEYDAEDGYYEIDIKSGNKEIELKINAENGAILKKEVDFDDDEVEDDLDD